MARWAVGQIDRPASFMEARLALTEEPAESYEELLAVALEKNKERERRLRECAFCEHGYEEHDLLMVEREIKRGDQTYTASVLSPESKPCTMCDCTGYAGLRRMYRYRQLTGAGCRDRRPIRLSAGEQAKRLAEIERASEYLLSIRQVCACGPDGVMAETARRIAEDQAKDLMRIFGLA